MTLKGMFFSLVCPHAIDRPPAAGDDVLENVAYARAHNSEQQMDLLKMASAMMAEDRCAPLLYIKYSTSLG